MAKELTGKTVLVTGASSGIGRAMALAVAAAGAKVALVGRSRERLQEVADLIGPDALVLPGDLGQPAEVERLPCMRHVMNRTLRAVFKITQCGMEYRQVEDAGRALHNLVGPIDRDCHGLGIRAANRPAAAACLCY